jgi:ActR/RegA family two-component response regulator
MSAKRPILIVEGDGDFCQTLAEHLNDDGGFAVVTAASLEAADAAFNTKGRAFRRSHPLYWFARWRWT